MENGESGTEGEGLGIDRRASSSFTITTTRASSSFTITTTRASSSPTSPASPHPEA